MSKSKVKYLALVTALAVTGPASAGLLGQSVTGSLEFPTVFPSGFNVFDPDNGFVPSSGYLNSTNPPGTTVTIQEPAIEFGYDDGSNLYTANFTDTTLDTNGFVQVTGTNDPFVMTFAFTPGLLASFDLIQGTDTFPSGLSYIRAGDTLTISWAGAAVTAGDSFTAVFTIGTNTLVPEPATLALMGVGLAGMIGLGKRRQVPAVAA